MKFNKLNLAVFFAMSGVAVTTSADQVETNLSPITVSASPIHEHAAFDVPSQIDSLSGADKSARQTGSLGEILDYIPGVNNMETGTQSGKPVIRGMTGTRIKVLANGQSLDYQQLGIRHLPNVDPFLSERIEVIRGPQSVLYGSEAMGGVVNVLDPRFHFDGKTRGEIATEFNSNNRERMLGAKVSTGSEKFSVYAGASTRKADNFRVPDVSSSEGATPSGAKSDKPLFVGEVPFTNFENRAANLGAGYKDDWGQIGFRYNEWHSKQNYLGIEADNGVSEYEPVPTGQKLNNQSAQLDAEIFAGNDWVIKPSWQTMRNQREAAHDLPFETMHQEKDDEEHYLDILIKRDDLKLAVEHPMIAGFEGEIGLTATRKDQELLSGHLTPSATENKRAIYLFEEADKGPWLIQFGLRHDWHDVHAPLDGHNEHFVDEIGVFDGSNNSRNFNVTSGSLGANYKFNNQWSLAANVATGFRAPSIFELYAGGQHGGVQAFQIANPDLDAEQSLNTDLSLRWQTKQTQMVATVYHNTVDNYIYLANTGFYRFKEGDAQEGEQSPVPVAGRTLVEMLAEQTNAQIQGFEFNLAHRFDSNWSGDFALELINGRDTSNSQDLALMPANNARFNVYFEPKEHSLLDEDKWQLGLKLVSARNSAGSYEPFSQFDENVKVGTASTDAYAVFDLGYQSLFKLNNQQLELDAKIENLFDTAYVDFINTYKGYTLNPGRNFKLGLRMKF